MPDEARPFTPEEIAAERALRPTLTARWLATLDARERQAKIETLQGMIREMRYHFSTHGGVCDDDCPCRRYRADIAKLKKVDNA